MHPERFQFTFSCRQCGRVGLMETVLRPHLSQAVTEIGYQREPCRFSNCDLCEHWFEAKAKASGVPIDARIAPDADG